MQKFLEEISLLGYQVKVDRKRNILTELEELGVKERELEADEADFLEFYKALPDGKQEEVKEVIKADSEKTRAIAKQFEERLQSQGHRRVRTKFFVAPYNAGIYLQVRIIHLKPKPQTSPGEGIKA